MTIETTNYLKMHKIKIGIFHSLIIVVALPGGLFDSGPVNMS